MSILLQSRATETFYSNSLAQVLELQLSAPDSLCGTGPQSSVLPHTAVAQVGPDSLENLCGP